MTAHKNPSTRAGRHAGASFSRTPGTARKAASLGLAACMIGGALLVAPAASAAPGDELGWTPKPSKTVVGSPSEAGDKGLQGIEGLGVWPGEKVEYNIGVDLKTTAGADEVTELSVVDKLPAGFTVDETSLRIVGDNNLQVAPTKDYTVTVEDSTLTLTFTPEWIAKHVGPNATEPTTQLAIFFEVTVPEDAKEYSSQANVATQMVNGESFETAPATILIPGADPSELVNGVDGKPAADRIAVGGDTLNYKVKLDGTFAADVEGKATPLMLAYDLTRFGIVDDFDEKAVLVSADSVRVLDSKGGDQTSLFTVTSKDGVLSVLANAGGSRNSVPAAVLGQDYTVEYSAQVRDVAKTGKIVGETAQVVDDREHPIEAETSVSVQAVAPTKSAVQPAVAPVVPVEPLEGEDGADGSDETVLETVAQNSEFAYKVGSSEVPANRLAPLTSWSVLDVYTSGDRSLHEDWSVVADTDILGTDGEVLIAAGTVLAEKGSNDYFTAGFNGDNFAVTATGAFLDRVNDDAGSALSWSVYVGATRTAAEGTRVSNTSNEASNGFSRGATVTTGTDAALVVAPPVEPTPTPTPDPSATPTPTPTPAPTDSPTATPSPEPSADPTAPADPEPTTEPTPPGEGDEGAPEDKLISIESFVLNADGEKVGDHDSPEDAFVVETDPAASASSEDGSVPAHAPVKVRFEITNHGETVLDNAGLVHTLEGNSTGSIGELLCETGDDTPAGTLVTSLAVGQSITCDGEITGITAGGTYASVSTVTADIAGAPAVEGAVARTSAEDGLFLTLAGDVTPAEEEAAAEDDKRGAVTGEAVSSKSPLLMAGGGLVLALFLGAGAFFGTRMLRGSSKE